MTVTNLDDLGIVIKNFPDTPTPTETPTETYIGAVASAVGETNVEEFTLANPLVLQFPIDGVMYP